MTRPALTPEDWAALHEVGETGGRRAALALSQLIGRDITVSTSQVSVVDCQEIAAILHGGHDVAAGLRFRFFGGALGTILLVFPEASARGLIARLNPPAAEQSDEQESSILREIGNILASAYLSAMGDRCSLVLIPSVPTLFFDRAPAVVGHLAGDLCEDADEALLITTRFSDPAGEATGRLFLVPDAPSLNLILEAMRAETGRSR